MDKPEELPRWLDGPRFIAFLLSEGVVKNQQPDATIRRWSDWERGGRADRYGAADRVMTENLISERMIPDDVWSADQRYLRKRSPIVDARRSEGLKMLEDGISVRKVSQALKISRRTVNRWRAEALTQEVS
jgi:DNA-binding NarL/FixJ family response regulator